MTKSARLLARLCLAALAVALLTAGANAHDSEVPWDLCRKAVAQANGDGELPKHLLTAIAQVESGRWHKASGEKLAWPWTVTAEGKGRHLPSKEAALAEIKSLQSRGVSSIDVGCMQINLRHHPEAFEDLGATITRAPPP
jgi:hypothetical protein